VNIRRVAITGATGPLGIALINYYIASGVAVTAIVHPSSHRLGHLHATHGLDVVPCDLASLAVLGSLLPTDYDAFFHLGWIGTDNRATRNDPTTHARNILYTLDAVNLAHNLGCSVFIGAGSHIEKVGISSDLPVESEETYGIAKYAAGRLSLKLCEQLSIRHCWGRVLSIYGPGDRATTALMYCIGTLLKGDSPSLTSGEQLWDYLYVDDCAAAFALMAVHGRHGASYDICSGESRPLREFFVMARDAIDPSLTLGLGDILYPQGQPMNLFGDIGPLRADTGFTPKIAFDEGIRETIRWLVTGQGESTGD